MPDAQPATWFQRNKPVLSFVGTFAVVFFVLFALTFNRFVEEHVFEPYLRLNTAASAALIGLFGTPVDVVEGTTLLGPVQPIEVRRGCDAVEPSALYVAAVVAFPAAVGAKLLGVLLGVTFLMLVNFARIVSLYYIGQRWPDLFELMHLDLWQLVFIVLSLATFLVWARWARA